MPTAPWVQGMREVEYKTLRQEENDLGTWGHGGNRDMEEQRLIFFDSLD
jgi:hypothetical protein